MVPNQLQLTRLAYTIHEERISHATAGAARDDEVRPRANRRYIRPSWHLLTARLLNAIRIGRVVRSPI